MPHLVVTTGLHGSASTWIFNIARRLLEESFGAAVVLACHALDASQLPAEPLLNGRHAIAKTHGWPGMVDALHARGARVVVSVRDPRDAMLSLVQRFGMQPETALRGIARDCLAALACADAGFPVLRYEAGFYTRPENVRLIAEQLGLAPDDATAAAIFAAFSTDAVRRFSADLKQLPPDRLEGSESFFFDRLTQITNAHIGDGRQGKWRDRFSPQDAAQLTRYFAPFLRRFDYPLE